MGNFFLTESTSNDVLSDNHVKNSTFAHALRDSTSQDFLCLVSGRIKGQRVQISTSLIIIFLGQVLLHVYAKFRVDILKTVGEEAI